MAEESPLNDWPIEDIPDADALFMRVHKNWFTKGNINLGVFRNRDEGMSTDWSRYSTARASRERARTPLDNAVIRMVAGEVRQIPGQRLQHSPIPENRSHTDVQGEKDEEARLLFGRIFKIALPVINHAPRAWL
jgi:hypothetical protein